MNVEKCVEFERLRSEVVIVRLQLRALVRFKEIPMQTKIKQLSLS